MKPRAATRGSLAADRAVRRRYHHIDDHHPGGRDRVDDATFEQQIGQAASTPGGHDPSGPWSRRVGERNRGRPGDPRHAPRRPAQHRRGVVPHRTRSSRATARPVGKPRASINPAAPFPARPQNRRTAGTLGSARRHGNPWWRHPWRRGQIDGADGITPSSRGGPHGHTVSRRFRPIARLGRHHRHRVAPVADRRGRFHRVAAGHHPGQHRRGRRSGLRQTRAAQVDWSNRPVADRIEIIERYRDLVVKNSDFLMDLLQAEAGKGPLGCAGGR